MHRNTEVCLASLANCTALGIAPEATRERSKACFCEIHEICVRQKRLFRLSIHVLHLAPVARLGGGCLVGITETYAEAELVAFAEAELFEHGLACIVIC